MMKRVINSRSYCVSVIKAAKKVIEDKLDFSQLRHVSKVPDQLVIEFNRLSLEDSELDKKTAKLLERLSLVNLDDEEVLKTLRNSIQFAKKIEEIDIIGTKPLYTVLENQPLQLRSDQVFEGYCREKILQNAKICEEDYFISPPGNIPLKQEEDKN